MLLKRPFSMATDKSLAEYNNSSSCIQKQPTMTSHSCLCNSVIVTSKAKYSPCPIDEKRCNSRMGSKMRGKRFSFGRNGKTAPLPKVLRKPLLRRFLDIILNYLRRLFPHCVASADRQVDRSALLDLSAEWEKTSLLEGSTCSIDAGALSTSDGFLHSNEENIETYSQPDLVDIAGDVIDSDLVEDGASCDTADTYDHALSHTPTATVPQSVMSSCIASAPTPPGHSLIAIQQGMRTCGGLPASAARIRTSTPHKNANQSMRKTLLNAKYAAKDCNCNFDVTTEEFDSFIEVKLRNRNNELEDSLPRDVRNLVQKVIDEGHMSLLDDLADRFASLNTMKREQLLLEE